MEEQKQMQEQNRMEQNEMPVQPAVTSQTPPMQPTPPVQRVGYGVPVQPAQKVTPSPAAQTGYGGTPVPPQMQPTVPLQMQPTVPPQMQPTVPQMGYGAPVSPYRYMGQPEKSSDGMAIASMVLGIVSTITCIWFYLSIPCAIIGLVLGCVYRSKGGKSGMSVAGIVCACVGLVLGCLMLFIMILDAWLMW